MSLPSLDRASALVIRLEQAGFARVDPPLLQPAGVFLDLSGEDLRRRLYLTIDAEGRELCLRPDLTIPTARLHLARAGDAAPAQYCYCGPVFRFRGGQNDEFLQGGFESFGRADRAEADADTLAQAVDALATWDILDPTIRLGDLELIAAFLEALALAPAWRRRILRGAARAGGVEAELAAMAAPSPMAQDRAALLTVLEGANPDAAQAVVENLLSIAGISHVGGRSAGEIAERFLEQARLSAGARMAETTRDALARFFDIAGPLPEALHAVKALAQELGLDMDAALDSFGRRTKAFAARGLDPNRIHFATRFGRRLDYYTGFVFELRGARQSEDAPPLAGGGRYDTLLNTLGAAGMVPAVGCAIWIDRLAQVAP